MIFDDYVLDFWIELHSIPGKIGKLSLLISYRKLPMTLGNCTLNTIGWLAGLIENCNFHTRFQHFETKYHALRIQFKNKYEQCNEIRRT